MSIVTMHLLSDQSAMEWVGWLGVSLAAGEGDCFLDSREMSQFGQTLLQRNRAWGLQLVCGGRYPLCIKGLSDFARGVHGRNFGSRSGRLRLREPIPRCIVH